MTALKKKIEGAKGGGFTLIELLIVIAILGVLAVVVLVAINPQEQLARTRDAGRTSSVTQIGHALQAYATAHEGFYPDATLTANCTNSDDWLDCLVDSGEIATAPVGLAYTAGTMVPCTVLVQPDGDGWCYVDDGTFTDIVVYGALEAGTNVDRCTAPAVPFIGFDSTLGRGGIFCATVAQEIAGFTPGGLPGGFVN